MYVRKGQGRSIKWQKRREDSLHDKKNEEERVTLCFSLGCVACLENLLSEENFPREHNLDKWENTDKRHARGIEMQYFLSAKANTSSIEKGLSTTELCAY